MGLPLAQLKYLDSDSKYVFQMQRLGVGEREEVVVGGGMCESQFPGL